MSFPTSDIATSSQIEERPPIVPFVNYHSQRGATSVEYALIVVLIIIVMVGVIIYMVNPVAPDNSLMPKTYNAIGNRVGNYGLVNLPGN